ncbi:hypothetical protein KC573_02265 [candidate division WWE3 bacterium]|uniref:Uncharacterized protein n=1 Tax=candidate division WWE3 bacterium TaxID=2053526 RepID=A0A955LVQ4_UNCKA|nr:hypothetical protein [candidate division WWE3 bacterium]
MNNNTPTISVKKVPDSVVAAIIPPLDETDIVPDDEIRRILEELLVHEFDQKGRPGGEDVWAHAIVDLLIRRGFAPTQMMQFADAAFSHLANPHKTASGAVNVVQAALSETSAPIIFEKVEVRTTVWRIRRRRSGE